MCFFVTPIFYTSFFRVLPPPPPPCLVEEDIMVRIKDDISDIWMKVLPTTSPILDPRKNPRTSHSKHTVSS